MCLTDQISNKFGLRPTHFKIIKKIIKAALTLGRISKFLPKEHLEIWANFIGVIEVSKVGL